MKVIVIGATGTIGGAVAKALAARGHEVVGASRKGDVRADLEDPGSLDALLERVTGVDAVVSCAGDAAFKPLAELTDADFGRSLRSKLMGQVGLVRAAAGRLREGGSVTVTTGVLATRPAKGAAAISLVNAGLEGFVRSAGLEMPRGIRVNAVSPGWVKETLAAMGMDPGPGIAAADCAEYYVQVVEGTAQGQVITAASPG